jgi:hypothetical protein
LYWICKDAKEVILEKGMGEEDALKRKKEMLRKCADDGLLDYKRLLASRLINEAQRTICPLCREELSASGFFTRLQQVEGRKIPDITVTEINMFHIKELRVGSYNHRPYNLGWGHHHCNVVTKDSGVAKTLDWMSTVISNNKRDGYF